MKTPKVSIIMPVYNTEKYVEDALRSIMNQTLTDIEIIVINDGSTDNSLQIINRLAAEDERIRVYSKENEGLSKSRNLGMQKISGEYVYFMDSDDLLELDALESCYERATKDNLDFVFFDADVFCPDDEQLTNDYYIRKYVLDPNTVFDGIELLDKLMAINLYRPSVWLCFIKREFVEPLKLDFFPDIIHEDELYTAILHFNAKRVGYLPFAYFKRRVRKNSITSSNFSMWNITCYLTVIYELKKYVLQQDKSLNSIAEKVYTYILNPAIYRASKFSFKNRLKVFKLCRTHDCLKYITSKNLVILFLPFTVRLKSQINKK